jgi:hypothetical protein
MVTQKIWASALDRRASRREVANFYAIEVEGKGRYLRRVRNVSQDGILFESPLGDERPGETVELELPRGESGETERVKGEVVYVTPEGQVGVRLDPAEPLDLEHLGGKISL